MLTQPIRTIRLLPDGSELVNHLLRAMPAAQYARIRTTLRMNTVALGQTLQEHGTPVTRVYFPNGGVYSITNQMRDGTLVEVATVGQEGMLGIGLFLGDAVGAGRTLLQVPDGPLPSMAADRFIEETAGGQFRNVVALYAQANLLQIMQSAACNALHDVTQRCCRWLLQTQDRVGASDFLLKQEFLAIMLGVRRPTVSLVMGKLQALGLIATRYGRIRILQRRQLQRASCECYEVTRAHFRRLALSRRPL
jgi:CRP-like cAMP-binding protein